MATTVRNRRRTEEDSGGHEAETSTSLRLPEKQEPQQVKGAHIITEYIEIGVPPEQAFDLWTQYEKWSQIFKNESADPNGDKRGSGGKRGGGGDEVKVRAKIGPSERQWTAEVLGAEQGRRLNWRSKGPLKAMGVTSFHSLDDRLTKVMVEIEYRPTGALETIGNFFRMQRRRVRRDLRLFKNYAELHGVGGGDDAGRDGDRDGGGKEGR